MTALLGGLTPAAFLRRHWQKRPLLIRQAVPGFRGFLDRDAMLALATRDDTTSRLVIEHPRRRGRARWERHDGPFGGLEPGMLPARHWTLLVHGIESLVPGGWELLRRFDFIPAARVDDLMVSVAGDGGSVGPHDDLYDVFLLQGAGRRRWQISTRPHAVDETAAIKVLKDFTPEEDWLLEPGDMLYLPPGVAHWGVADGPCLTYSIGFLAPSHQDLVLSFLGFLGPALLPGIDPAALYRDPGLRPPRSRLELGEPMIDQVAAALGVIRWDRATVAEFLGRFLTMPKPHVRFAPPRRPLALEAFARRLRGPGRLALALPSRGLVRRGRLFLNGAVHDADPRTIEPIAELLDARALTLPRRLSAAAVGLLHGWYLAGAVVV